MAELDPALVADYRNYQKDLRARRARQLATTATAIGMDFANPGSGAAYRDKQRAYVEGGIDGDAAWMDDKERLEAKASMAKVESQQEQYYYGKNQDKMLNDLQREQNEWKALLNAQQQHYATSTNAQINATRFRTAQLEAEIEREQTKRTELLMGDEVQQAQAASMVATAQNDLRADAEAAALEYNDGSGDRTAKGQAYDAYLANLSGGDPDFEPTKTQRSDALEYATEQLVTSEMTNDIRATATQAIAQSDDPVEQLQILSAIAQQSNIPLEELTNDGGQLAATVAEAKPLRDAQLKDADEAIDARYDKWGQIARQTHGGKGDFPDKLDAFEATRMETRAPSAPAPAPQTAPTAGPSAPPAAAVEPGAPSEPAAPAAPVGAQPYAQYRTGPGAPQAPASSAQARTLQLFDEIEQYPDSPPVQYQKQMMMASPQFAAYKEARGYQDDDFAFKEMAREARVQIRQNKRQDRKTKRENIDMGIAKAGTGERVVKRVASRMPTPGVPVAGDGRTS